MPHSVNGGGTVLKPNSGDATKKGALKGNAPDPDPVDP